MGFGFEFWCCFMFVFGALTNFFLNKLTENKNKKDDVLISYYRVCAPKPGCFLFVLLGASFWSHASNYVSAGDTFEF
jgi:polyferredoxin